VSKLELRFVSYENDTGSAVGIESSGRVLDLLAAEELLAKAGLINSTPELPSDMLGIIKAGEVALKRIEDMLSAVNHGADVVSAWLPEGSYQLLPPIPNPEQNLLCLGLNYASHLNEAESVLGIEAGENSKPPLVMFSKRINTIIGHDADIPLHAGITEQPDYEAELAFVIGKTGTNITRDEADSHIFGYTIVNEVSARDLQVKHLQVFKGKSLDGYCPVGPVLVHKSAMPRTPAEGLTLRSYVNGELRHDTSTSQLIYDIPSAISILSEGMTLFAGEVVATGNPSGSAISFDPPRFLNAGDRVEVEIEGIGTLGNFLATT